VIQSSKDVAYLARHVGIRIGLQQHIPALSINRLCGSGFQSIISAAHEILNGEAHVAVAGGTESMSQAPFAVRNIRFGTGLGKKYEFEDTLWEGLTDNQIKTPMGVTAENLGAKYGVSRQEADEFALRSQTRWRLANNAGYFKAETAPITVKGRGGKEEVFDTDEHPRETTLESLASLKPVFKKDGLVTAGSASGVCDGAGAVVVADEESLKKHRLTPLARIVSWHVAGVDPNIMGIGPVPAIRGALKKANLKLEDIDLVEVNEAFAAQYLAVEKDLGLSPDSTNVNGGAIALGHPLGASGSRITAHLVHELRRRKAKYGIGSACIGGGQGIAILLESV
jgi:acetyl-CoA acyltransferase 2